MTKVDLPADFSPEKYARGGVKPTEFREGVNVLQHDPASGFHLIAQVERAAAGAVIRCWHCYKRPDGTFDCFEITCPWSGGISTGTIGTASKSK
jgi:hypothetical protein